MDDNAIARKVSYGMNNTYVETIEVINLDSILRDLFVPDYIKEELLEAGFIEEYSSGDCEIVVVSSGEETLVALNNFPSDTAEYLFHRMDGSVWVATTLPCMEYLDGSWYAGDEILEVGKVSCYTDKISWCWNSLQKVNKYKSFGISVETMKKIIAGLEGV